MTKKQREESQLAETNFNVQRLCEEAQQKLAEIAEGINRNHNLETASEIEESLAYFVDQLNGLRKQIKA